LTRFEGGGIQRDQGLTIPVPVAVQPSMTLWIGWQSEHLCQGKRAIC
jgi:hypothetical protein